MCGPEWSCIVPLKVIPGASDQKPQFLEALE